MAIAICSCDRPPNAATKFVEPPLITLETLPSADNAPMRQTFVLLSHHQPEIRLNDVPLEKAFQSVGDGKVTLQVDVAWEKLPSGITRDKPVSTRLKNVRLDKILFTLLSSVDQSIKNPKLGYVVQGNGRVLITSRRELYTKLATVRRYSIGSLLSAGLPPESVRDAAKQITGIITETVAPYSWATSTNPIGATISSDGDTLTILQTADAHFEIYSLLHQMWDQHHFPTSQP